MPDVKAEIFPRSDGTWGWHALAANNQIVASDAGQGYENREDAVRMMTMVLGGQYARSVGRLLPEDPGVDVICDWVTETMQEMLGTLGAFADVPVDLIAAAVADRVHGQLWGYPPGQTPHSGY